MNVEISIFVKRFVFVLLVSLVITAFLMLITLPFKKYEFFTLRARNIQK